MKSVYFDQTVPLTNTYHKTVLPLVVVFFASLAIIGCSTTGEKKFPVTETTTNPALSINNQITTLEKPSNTDLSNTFSFRAKDIDLRSALEAFSQMYNLNMYVDPGLGGNVTASFSNVTLEKALEVLLDAQGYGWEKDGDVIRVKKVITRIFKIDYVYLQRSGQFTSSAGINSTSHTGGGGGSSSTLTQSGQIDFWKDMESELSKMISKEGRMHINRLSGLVQVTDNYARIKEIGNFLNGVTTSILKQVLIEARIVEVTLREDESYGIDWDKLSAKGVTGFISNLVSSPVGGSNAKSPTLSLSKSNNNFTALFNALYEQGEVNVVSQPRIRVLNNQSSVIKVGTDRTFFTQTVTRTPTTTSSSDLVITETPTTVTEGLVLTVTPQISNQDWIILDIAPVLTRVIDTVTSPQGSTAPVLDVKQASSLLRIQNGDTALLGGLIQEEKTRTVRRIPFLGAIPLLGYLFQASYDTNKRKELVIMISAKVIPT